MNSASDTRRVLAFYQFAQVSAPQVLRDELDREGQRLDLKGTILVASEGINGTIVGSVQNLQAFQTLLDESFTGLPYKWSDLNADNLGFHRFKVRVKAEIVTFGMTDLDPRRTGEHVDAEQWHALLDDPDVVVIDTRNQYEVDIGSFPQALSPQTTNFREFPTWVEAHLDPARHKQVAMFCTGGIRCEKASAFMLAQGYEHVYQLDGGILKYLENVAPDENRWQGECFVFDQRVSVNAQLQQGEFQQCYACRHPLSAAELASESYEKGVSCPHCAGSLPAQRIDNLRHRQMQVELARERGQQHIGHRQGQAGD